MKVTTNVMSKQQESVSDKCLTEIITWQHEIQLLGKKITEILKKIESIEDLLKSHGVSDDPESYLLRKVGRAYIKTRRFRIENELLKLTEKLKSIEDQKLFFRNQLVRCELTYTEEMALNPCEGLKRAIVRFTHGNPHLEGKKAWGVFNTQTLPKLQDGPQCGIIALAVALKTIDYMNEIDIDQIMDVAKRKGFTNRGEMFSVDDMATLARSLTNVNAKVEEVSKLLDTAWLVDFLMRGNLCLVPYDCGPDFRPIQACGHKAHWAVVSGFLYASNKVPINSSPISACSGFHQIPNKSLSCEELQDIEESSVMVVTRQSKSVELCIWNRNRLVESCCNLREAAPKRLDGSYILPDGGLVEGLCGKLLILQPASLSL